MARKNKNRGYQQLRVWNDAVEFYAMNSRVFLNLSYSLKRVTSQQLASSDSVHRNIALGSLGESVSGLNACLRAGQISTARFEALDFSAFKLDNGLLKLISSLEQMRDAGTWTDQLMVKESNAIYDC